AADHSGSIVVDVPFGVRGGVPLAREGGAFDPEAQVLATADGHPRAVGYLSRLPESTLMAVRRDPFYARLLSAQGQPPRPTPGGRPAASPRRPPAPTAPPRGSRPPAPRPAGWTSAGSSSGSDRRTCSPTWRRPASTSPTPPTAPWCTGWRRAESPRAGREARP